MKRTAPPSPIHKKSYRKEIVIAIIGFSILIFVGSIILFKILYSNKDSIKNEITSCDVNNDSLCDFHDIETIKNAMGTCKGDYLYSEQYDMNNDGCLTEDEDLEKLLKLYYSILDYEKVPTPIITPYDPSCDHDKDNDCDDYNLYRIYAISRERDAIKLLKNIIGNYHGSRLV